LKDTNVSDASMSGFHVIKRNIREFVQNVKAHTGINPEKTNNFFPTDSHPWGN
jgi:hypothetical protein